MLKQEHVVRQILLWPRVGHQVFLSLYLYPLLPQPPWYHPQGRFLPLHRFILGMLYQTPHGITYGSTTPQGTRSSSGTQLRKQAVLRGRGLVP